jgi:hypothetical protein
VAFGVAHPRGARNHNARLHRHPGWGQVFADFKNNLMYVIKKNGGHVRLQLGSPDANSVVKGMTPTKNAPPGIKHPPSTGHMPIGAPLELHGSKPAQAVGETLHFDNRVGIRNRALRERGRSLHILDHMAPPPPKPVTIQDHSGGMVSFNIA